MRAFHADRLFAAGPDDAVLEDAAVVVDESGLIHAVGEAARVVPQGAEVQRVRGALLPGLFDVHTHVCLSAGANPGRDAQTEHPTRIALRAAENLKRHLDAGVTTIRDVGGVHGVDLELMRLVDEGVVEGPDMLAAGNVICITGGHGCWMGIECDGEDEVRKATRTVLQRGARVVKLIATGGVITPGVRPGAAQLSYDEMRVACLEAKKASRTVAAHAQGSEGIEDALRAGVDTIEHGFWLSDAAVRLMREEGRTLVPTFAALRTMQRDRAHLPAFIVQKLDEVDAPQRASFARAREAGVRIAAGTDAGTPGNPHGSIAVELTAFQELGVAPLDCWRAATSWAAAACGLDDRGVLSPGKRADLIAVDESALSDLTRFTKPSLVVKRGAVVRGG